MAKLSAKEARERFGLAYNDSHASGGAGLKDGAMYVDGQYIGSMTGTKMEQQRSGPDEEAQGIGKYKAIQDYAIDNGFGEERAEWNSYNDVQGALEEVIGAGEAPAAEPKAKAPVVLSDRAAQAIAGTKAYEDVMLPRQGDYTIGGDKSVVSDFNDQFRLNLAKAKSPQPQEPSELQNAEAQADQQKVMDYANNYKKAVGDTLRPSNRA